MTLSVAFAIGIALLAQAPAPPPVPEGLWLSRDEGFVVRIEPCGDGFCGIAAGEPREDTRDKREDKAEKPKDTCGKTMMKDFKWNAKARRWEGTMQPPGKPGVGGSISSKGDA